MQINIKSLQAKVNAAVNSPQFRSKPEVKKYIENESKKIPVVFDIMTGLSANVAGAIRNPASLHTNKDYRNIIYHFEDYLLREIQAYFEEGTDREMYNSIAPADRKSLFSKLTTSQLMEPLRTYDVRNKNGTTHVVELHFIGNAVHRNSLMPRKYRRGIDNILLLKTKGWDFTNKTHGSYYLPFVHGIWRGYDTPALAKGDADDFLLQLIADYNRKYMMDNVRATLDRKYS